MKIGDIEVGKEYGAVDEPNRSGYSVTPRQVKVLEIVPVEEQYWSGGGFTSTRSTRTVRKVKIEVLDQTLVKSGSSWARNEIKEAKKGTKLVISARSLIGLWKDLSPGIAKQIAEKQAEADKLAETEARLKKLGFKDLTWGAVNVHVRDGGKRVEIEFNDRHAERVLALLEAK